MLKWKVIRLHKSMNFIFVSYICPCRESISYLLYRAKATLFGWFHVHKFVFVQGISCSRMFMWNVVVRWRLECSVCVDSIRALLRHWRPAWRVSCGHQSDSTLRKHWSTSSPLSSRCRCLWGPLTHTQVPTLSKPCKTIRCCCFSYVTGSDAEPIQKSLCCFCLLTLLVWTHMP